MVERKLPKLSAWVRFPSPAFSKLNTVLFIFLWCFIFPTYAEDNNNINTSGVKINWSYKGNNGPTRWGQLNPQFVLCAKGKKQSPINIDSEDPEIIKTPNDLVMRYQLTPMIIVENGNTNLLINNQHFIINDGHGIQLNFNSSVPGETIYFKNKHYSLVQFHIHTPSENELDGENFPMEIHFVHQSQDGFVLVMAVFVKTGEANPSLQKMIDHFPKDHGIAHNIEDKINPFNLLPINRDYYSFMGSLTTPPCTEGLQWLVMVNPITASSAQILLFREVVGGSNARPVQSKNQRPLFFSTAGTISS